MYRETVHTARYVHEERQRRARTQPSRQRRPFAMRFGRMLVMAGERLQRGAGGGRPLAEV